MAGKEINKISESLIGTLIDGKYRVLEMIGKGGMSGVFLAQDERLNKKWALKVIKKSGEDREGRAVINSALTEANLLKKLDHPLLPRIVDIIMDDEMIFVVMDYIEGETLAQYLKREKKAAEDKVMEWGMSLCEALEYLHSLEPKIIYRDMKPGNVMLTKDGRIKLIDFGIAREYKSENTGDTVCLGTKGYAAPEQFGGSGQSDERTDIYCLGVTMYHLVTGKNPCEPPYKIYPIRHWDLSLSPGLEAVIKKCTQPNPADRYQNASELKNALLNYEKEDEVYKKKRRGHIRLYKAAMLFSALCFLTGVMAGEKYLSAEEKDYDKYLSRCDMTADENLQRQYACHAVSVKPGDTAGYEKLIEIYKKDGVFLADEEEEYLKLYEKNADVLKESDDYGRLCFDTGKLYWYYYPSDDEVGLAGMESSRGWFKNAIDYGSETDEYMVTAMIYYGAGDFYHIVTSSMEEGTDEGIYRAYANELSALIDYAWDEPSDYVKLQICRLAVISVESYGHRFAYDGVSKEALTELVTVALDMSESIDVSGGKTGEIKEYIEDHKSSVINEIEMAYE